MGSHWRALAPPMSHERGRRERNVKRWLSRDKMPIDTIGDSRTKLVRVNLPVNDQPRMIAVESGTTTLLDALRAHYLKVRDRGRIRCWPHSPPRR